MTTYIYAPIFVRQFNKLSEDLQDDVLGKIVLFKDTSNHKQLKVHKLQGKFKDCYSFSINYKYRIIFNYDKNKNINYLGIGDHEIYK